MQNADENTKDNQQVQEFKDVTNRFEAEQQASKLVDHQFEKSIKKMIMADLKKMNQRWGHGSDYSRKDGAPNYVKMRLRTKFLAKRKAHRDAQKRQRQSNS